VKKLKFSEIRRLYAIFRHINSGNSRLASFPLKGYQHYFYDIL